MDRDYTKILESNYFLFCGDQKIIHKELAAIDLLDSEKTLEFLQEYRELIKAEGTDVSATYFGSKFGMICSSFISLLSLFHVKLPISLDSLYIQFYRNEQFHFDDIAFKLKNENWVQGAESEDWRRQEIEAFFQTLVTPLLEHIGMIADIRMREIWGQMVVGLEFGYQKALSLAETEQQRERIESDYQWLTHEANPAIFHHHKNALNFPFIEVESTQNPDVKQRMKPTCCLYYKTEYAKNKCYTCPRLTPAEREKLKQELVK